MPDAFEMIGYSQLIDTSARSRSANVARPYAFLRKRMPELLAGSALALAVVWQDMATLPGIVLPPVLMAGAVGLRWNEHRRLKRKSETKGLTAGVVAQGSAAGTPYALPPEALAKGVALFGPVSSGRNVALLNMAHGVLAKGGGLLWIDATDMVSTIHGLRNMVASLERGDDYVHLAGNPMADALPFSPTEMPPAPFHLIGSSFDPFRGLSMDQKVDLLLANRGSAGDSADEVDQSLHALTRFAFRAADAIDRFSYVTLFPQLLASATHEDVDPFSQSLAGAYLGSLKGFDPSRGRNQAQAVIQQHEKYAERLTAAVDAVNSSLGNYAPSLGLHGDIVDLGDVVRSRMILSVNLPRGDRVNSELTSPLQTRSDRLHANPQSTPLLISALTMQLANLEVNDGGYASPAPFLIVLNGCDAQAIEQTRSLTRQFPWARIWTVTGNENAFGTMLDKTHYGDVEQHVSLVGLLNQGPRPTRLPVLDRSTEIHELEVRGIATRERLSEYADGEILFMHDQRTGVRVRSTYIAPPRHSQLSLPVRSRVDLMEFDQ